MQEIPFTLSDADFIQTTIDLKHLKPADFEKLIFYLLDEIGFSNIVWRKGGEGNSATDGGRDLEATFWRIEPIGSCEQNYWIEVKHRRGQLEKSQVQHTIVNAIGNKKINCLVIVTNATVSNPCIDWVNEFKAQHKEFSITIWQGHDLELLLRKNPRTLATFLPEVLNFSGRCKVIVSQLENLFWLPSAEELKMLWDNREQIKEDSFLLLAAIFSSVSHDKLVEFPWGVWLDEDELNSLTALAMLNFFAFILKIRALNRSEQALLKSLSYMLQCVSFRSSEVIAAKILFNVEELYEDSIAIPLEIRDMRAKQILESLMDDLASNCSERCSKLMLLKDNRDGANANYFSRFNPNIKKEPEEGKVYISTIDKECSLGLFKHGEFCQLIEDLPEDHLDFEFVLQKFKQIKGVLTGRLRAIEERA